MTSHETARRHEEQAHEIIEARLSVAEIKASKGKARLFKVINRAGEVVGRTTHGKVLEAAARVAEIELAVVDGQRPTRVPCIGCGALREVAKYAGALPKWCVECKKRKKCEREQRRRAADPETHRARRKAWNAANADKIKEHRRSKYAANPKKYKERARAWAVANPEAAKAKAARQGAKQKAKRAPALAHLVIALV